MKLSVFAKNIEKMIAENGDLDVFSNEGWAVTSIEAVTKEEIEWPDDWNMPEKFAVIGLRN